MDLRFSERRMGKGTPWSDEEVKALINIWAEMYMNKYLNDSKKLDTTRTGCNAERNSRT